MFGIIVSGRLVNISYYKLSVNLICFVFQVQTDFSVVDMNKFLITIQNADDINHVVVFMTGSQPFPEGMGGSGEPTVFTYAFNHFNCFVT